MISVKKYTNQGGHFKDAAKFIGDPMESSENRRYKGVSITVCDNPSRCFLDTLEFVHVETGFCGSVHMLLPLHSVI